MNLNTSNHVKVSLDSVIHSDLMSRRKLEHENFPKILRQKAGYKQWQRAKSKPTTKSKTKEKKGTFTSKLEDEFL